MNAPQCYVIHNGPWGSRRLRLPDFLDFDTMKVVRSSALRSGRLYPQEFSWYSFIEADSTPEHMVLSVKVKVKFSRYRPEQALGDPVG